MRLIRDYPLAWIIPRDASVQAVLLPILVECDPAGAPVSLLGHAPKTHPHIRAFARDPSARFLFTGPNGYISPALLNDKDWAPTWNYAAVEIEADVHVDDALTSQALERLVDHMERTQATPWTVAALGERYQSLRSRVIGFRAQVREMHARFKLGQDEDGTTFSQIVSGLDDEQLAEWMMRFRK